MRYLLRDGKVEFSGTKKEVLDYIREAYSDDYFVENYGNSFEKDKDRLDDCLAELGLFLTNSKPKGKK